MLSDRYYELLTAYVDGELSARQRKAVARLLHRSAEARTLLRQLRQDAESLRRLPRRGLDPDFPSRVLQAIRDRDMRLRRRLEHTQPQPYPVWVGIALAASVLFLIGFGSYFYFALSLPHAAPVALAPGNGEAPPATSVRPERPPAEPNHDATPAEEPKRPEPPPAEPVAAGPQEKPEPSKGPAANEPNPETALTLPVPEKEMFQPRAANVALPLVLKFADLDSRKLREELQKDSGFRLEMPCRESAVAFEHLRTAFKARGVGLLIDQVAQARLKQPRLRTNFVLYAEDLLPDELAAILHQVGAEDRKAAAKHKGEAQFDGFVVTHMGEDDRKELSKLLGVEPKQMQTPHSGAPLGLDPKKPLSEVTAEQVAQALAGQGGSSRSEAGKPAAKAAEHLALVLPYNPVGPRPGSPEVKHFLDSRKPPRSGTVQVLLVLRETKR
jgi:hypothetical protein